jgi:uncharacterized protein YbjT (DUF2867 family)
VTGQLEAEHAHPRHRRKPRHRPRLRAPCARRGHRVRAFARSAESIPLEHENLEKRTGDAAQADDVAAALDGIDAVILALGIPKTAAALLRPITSSPGPQPS